MKKKKQQELEDSFFDDVNGYSLDLNQRKIILDKKENILVVAGAGSGKTLTMVGKIKYLIEKENINPKDILCISFTNETVLSLKNKLDYEIDVFTFHKLSLEILKDHHIFFQISENNYLNYLVTEYFESIINYHSYLNYLIDYFKLELNEDNITLEMLKNKYNKELVNFQKLIISFINNIKSNNHNINDLKNYLKRNKYLFSRETKLKNKYFLLITFDIYRLYLEELKSSYQLDFDMMISVSSEIIKKFGMKHYYSYIIIDEFQDTSMVRYDLVKQIQKECDSKILCVGDDFQSIYKFSGCTLDLFVNFKKYFKPSKVMYMNKTYRNSLDLIKISYGFIIKNRYQLSKKIISDKRLKYPIKLIYYTKSNYEFKFNRLLDKLYQEGKREILVLGRYHHDIEMVYKGNLKNGYLVYKDMKIRYLTVHTSKGLEEDNVIVLNLTNNILGFPSQIKEEELMKLCFKNKEKYLYAEERRLFYVALTRTKNYVYLMTMKNNESIFVHEIKRKCDVLNI